MSNIGTLTFHRASNHGAMLQAVALQRALDTLGCENEVLDYRSPVIEARYRRKRVVDLLRPGVIARVFLRNSYTFDDRTAFAEFRSSHLRVSNRQASTPSEFTDLVSDYKQVIVGSDQVWNPAVSGGDYTYFLEGVPATVRRASYAASFGVTHLPGSIAKRVQKPLQEMDVISVREPQAVDIVADASGREAVCVVDPTMLHSADEWGDILDLRVSEEFRRPYVFMYLLHEDRELIRYAKRLAERLEAEVIYVSQRLFKPRGIRTMRGVGPELWLSLLSNSSAVVTNSFHGTAMSITMSRDLHVGLLPARTGVNSRILNVLEMAGLSDRLIASNPDPGTISWEPVHSRMAAAREQSNEVLRKLITNEGGSHVSR